MGVRFFENLSWITLIKITRNLAHLIMSFLDADES